jgi:Glycosyltransferase
MISKALVVGAYHTKLEEMVRLGIHLDVVIPQDWDGQKAERIQRHGYTLHTLPVVFSGKNHFHYYPTLSTLINKIKPDIIHVDEESFSFVTYLVIRQAHALGIPTLFFSWQNIFKKYAWPFSAMERYSMKYAAVGIAGNMEAKDVLRQKGCKHPIFIIPQFGVDTKVFCKRPQNELRKRIFANPNTFVVGYVGRLVEEKGIDDLLQAGMLLHKDIHFLFIGSGNQRLVLQRNAISYGISDRVHFVDYVKSTDMPQYLNILDCLVLPSHTRSNWKEQFGRVLIEAMACEVSVIGSNSAEIPNVIGHAGLIYPEGNVNALRDTIEKIFSDNILKLKLAREGRERVEKYFTQRTIAEETVKVYRSVLKK